MRGSSQTIKVSCELRIDRKNIFATYYEYKFAPDNNDKTQINTHIRIDVKRIPKSRQTETDDCMYTCGQGLDKKRKER